MVVSSLSLRHPSSLNFVRLLGAGNLVWVGTNWWERSRPQAHHAVPSPRAGRHWPLWTVPGKTAKNFLERQQAWVQCMEQHHLGQGCSGWAGERQTPWESCPASFWGSPPYRYPLGPSHGLALESTPVNKAFLTHLGAQLRWQGFYFGRVHADCQRRQLGEQTLGSWGPGLQSLCLPPCSSAVAQDCRGACGTFGGAHSGVWVTMSGMS